MAIKYYTSFSLVFLTTFLLAGHLATARILQVDLCQKTDYPKLCMTVQKGVVNDPRVATKVAINALIDQTNRAKATAAILGKSPKVENCLDSYDDAVENLKKSLDNINQNDPGSLMSNLSAAVADFGTCDDAFPDAHLVFTLSATNKQSRRMASNCMALAGLIKF